MKSSTSRKYPGCGWSRVYVYKSNPHRGWVFDLIVSKLSMVEKVALPSQMLFWKLSKLFLRDPAWPVLPFYHNFYEYEMLIEKLWEGSLLIFTTYQCSHCLVFAIINLSEFVHKFALFFFSSSHIEEEKVKILETVYQYSNLEYTRHHRGSLSVFFVKVPPKNDLQSFSINYRRAKTLFTLYKVLWETK